MLSTPCPARGRLRAFSDLPFSARPSWKSSLNDIGTLIFSIFSGSIRFWWSKEQSEYTERQQWRIRTLNFLGSVEVPNFVQGSQTPAPCCPKRNVMHKNFKVLYKSRWLTSLLDFLVVQDIYHWVHSIGRVPYWCAIFICINTLVPAFYSCPIVWLLEKF